MKKFQWKRFSGIRQLIIPTEFFVAVLVEFLFSYYCCCQNSLRNFVIVRLLNTIGLSSLFSFSADSRISLTISSLMAFFATDLFFEIFNFSPDLTL